MIKKFRACIKTRSITIVYVEKESMFLVWVGGVRNTKHTTKYGFFNTFELARDWLLNNLFLEIKEKSKLLKNARKEYAELCKLKSTDVYSSLVYCEDKDE